MESKRYASRQEAERAAVAARHRIEVEGYKHYVTRKVTDGMTPAVERYWSQYPVGVSNSCGPNFHMGWLVVTRRDDITVRQDFETACNFRLLKVQPGRYPVFVNVPAMRPTHEVSTQCWARTEAICTESSFTNRVFHAVSHSRNSDVGKMYTAALRRRFGHFLNDPYFEVDPGVDVHLFLETGLIAGLTWDRPTVARRSA